ncbi:MAG: hypothetical protein ACK5ZV_05605 [bacterium]
MLVGKDEQVICFASSLLKQELDVVGGELCLSKHYESNLLRVICARILNVTSERTPWESNVYIMKSGDVYDLIKSDLDVLISAAWSDDCRREIAKLKYTLENGERPRLWLKDYVGHYGFRVRTRDHTWLVGELFVDSALGADVDEDVVQLVDHGGVWQAGRVFVRVEEFGDRDCRPSE